MMCISAKTYLPRIRMIPTILTMLFMTLPVAAADFHILADTPSGVMMVVYGVSYGGSVVIGTSKTPEVQEAFQMLFGQMTRIGFLGDSNPSSIATAVSSDGSTIIGHSRVENGMQAFLWQDGVMTGIGTLGSKPGLCQSRAMAVSSNGSVVVGYAYHEEATLSGTEAFRWINGAMTGLGDLAGVANSVDSKAMGVSGDGTIIVGTSFNGDGKEAFRWQDGQMVGLGYLTPLGDELDGCANAISTNGKVIVGYSTSAYGKRAFRWKDGQMASLGLIEGATKYYESSATSTCADGSIVVGYYENGLGERAFIWDAVNGFRDLQLVLEQVYHLSTNGYRLVKANAISGDGKTIVGIGRDAEGVEQGWIASLQ